MMEEKIENKLAEEDLLKISGGENLDVSKYSEEELAKIFQLYFEMYGYTGALPYLSSWGVNTGDFFLMTHRNYWVDTPYYDAPDGARMAHLVYKRLHG
ncbi:MAG: hypothetical protein IKD68_00105 [Solobacterium sp.]|nr:hypothetical protein [Solobacterium sp.]